MKLLNLLLLPFKFIIKIIRKLRNRWIIAKASLQMERVFKKQLIQRRQLRADVNSFLRDYFGIDANSKFIPPHFKNPEEVKTAVQAKFLPRMESLNVSYTDLFK